MSSFEETSREPLSFISMALSVCFRSQVSVEDGTERFRAGKKVAAKTKSVPKSQSQSKATTPTSASPVTKSSKVASSKASTPVRSSYVIKTQPSRSPVTWMPSPAAKAGCPVGLEYLTLIDQIIVEQLVEVLEVLTGVETANRYIIRNIVGQQIYYAMEISTQSQRSYAGPWRAFTMRLTDNDMKEVIRIHRPEEPCCDYAEAFVEAPPGNPIAYIKGSRRGFTVYDPKRHPFLNIVQPDVVVNDMQTIFGIQSAAKQPIGMLVKHYGGALKEALTNADTFSLHFPMDLSAEMKAALVAAVFMVDFRHFEDKH